MRYLFSFLIFLSVSAGAQEKSVDGSQSSLCFDVKELHTTLFDEMQLGYVFLRDSNVICYTDTLGNSDTVRIAYKCFTTGKWMTFPTPFVRQFLRTDLYLDDLDHDGQKELIINGDASYDTWPRGNATNYATVIFKLDRVAKIVFQCTNGCWVSNLSGHYSDNPLDFGIGRVITTDSTGLHIGPLKLSLLTTQNEKNAFKEFCRLSAIKAGTYKFENGRFVKQEKE